MVRTDSRHSPNTAELEFSRSLPLSRLGPQGLRQHVSANSAERQAVASRLGLKALNRLEADLIVTARAGGKLVEVEGDLFAEVTQTCVVTLDPVESALQEHFLQRFTIDPEFAQSDEIVVDVEEDDAPEPLADEEVDLGEAVVQQLALALDPYPRKAGARLEWRETEEDESNPFAVLKQLKKDE
jgi:uncharacterized metal-binding protein YceD (DUF177 family)